MERCSISNKPCGDCVAFMLAIRRNSGNLNRAIAVKGLLVVVGYVRFQISNLNSSRILELKLE